MTRCKDYRRHLQLNNRVIGSVVKLTLHCVHSVRYPASIVYSDENAVTEETHCVTL